LALSGGQFVTLNVNSFYAPHNPENLLEEVGFFTDDAAALMRFLESRNVTVHQVSSGRARSFVVHDPEGHPIEFIEGKPLSEIQFANAPAAQRLRIIHAGFIVKNRAAEDEFYRDILGFRPYWHGGMKDDETSWVSQQVPDGSDWIEYMLYDQAGKDKHFRGVMNHFAIGVADIHAAQEQLRKNGAPLTEEPKIGRDGKWQLNLYDPDETRIEFMEFTPVQKPCCSEFTAPHPKP